MLGRQLDNINFDFMKNVDFSKLTDRLNSINFGLSGMIGSGLISALPIYGTYNTLSKNDAISRYGLSSEVSSKDIFLHRFLMNIGILTSNLVPLPYIKQIMHAINGLFRFSQGALVGDKFQDLCELLTNEVAKVRGIQNGTRDYKKLYRVIKDELYNNYENVLKEINTQEIINNNRESI